MDRRNAIAAALAVPLSGFLPKAWANTQNIDIDDGTAVVAIKFNGKTFALGIKMVPGDPHANTKLFHELARIFERKGLEIAPFI